ncbi:MAG: phosphatidate cytidylyltransferase [Calditrichaceae bacterium]
MKEFLTRVAVAIVGIPLLIFLIWEGGVYFLGLMVLIASVGQWELYRLTQAKTTNAQNILGIITTLAILQQVHFGVNNYGVSFLILMVLIIFASEMFRNNGSPLMNISATFLGIVYPGLFVASMLFLRNHIDDIIPGTPVNSAALFILAMFVSVWICDTFAYLFGKKFGKHKLFERVSPKKSIEGGIAGLIGGILTFLVITWTGILKLPIELSLASGIIVGVAGQLGDLVESWFKRDAKIKDSSNLLPGHGGMLDRFDSLLFISPLFLIIYLVWI